MVSKNNLINHLKFKSDNKQRFAIKKFTVGAASVLIGTTLYAGGMVAHADEANTITDNVVESVVNTATDDSDKDKSDDDFGSESTVSENNNEAPVVNDSESTDVFESKDVTSEPVENKDTNTVNKNVSKATTTDAVDVNNSTFSESGKTDNTTSNNVGKDVQANESSVAENVNAINVNSSEENKASVTNDVDSTTDTVNNSNLALRSVNQNNEVSVDLNKNSAVENRADDKQELGTITVDFVDDETGKVVGTVSGEGRPGYNVAIDKIMMDFSSTFDRLIGSEFYQGVDFEFSDKITDFFVIGFVENENRKFEVHLVHQKRPFSEDGSRNMFWDFKYKDTGADVKDYDWEQVVYYRHGVLDLVTGITTYEPIYLIDSEGHLTKTEFTPDYTLGSSLKMPVVPGYSTYVQQWVLDLINGVKSEDKTLVKIDKFPAVNLLTANRVFNGNDNLLDVQKDEGWRPITIYYVKDDQKINVKYIDDSTGQELHVDSLVGKGEESSGYTTADKIKELQSQGYKLVSDSTDGKALIFDDDSNTDQEYVVHLTHATESVSDTKTVNRVVHYVDQNNNKLFDNHVDKPLEFKRTGTKDLVTGEITWNDWDTQTKEFELVISPTKAGYTPSVKFVPSSEVTPESANIEETVVYVPNKQYVVVNYIDDTTGTVLTTDSLNGASEETLDYTTKPKIKDYEGMGYELVSDETNGNPIVLDSNDEKTQIYNVHLKHGFESLSDNKTVKRTIHYVDPDGKTLVNDYVYPVKEFIRTGVKDKVTGEIIWNDWSNVDAFSAMAIPAVTGYVPDFAKVEAYTPTADEGDTEFTVTYTKAEQKAQITFIDDTLDKVLTTQDANGKFGEVIVFDQLDETLAEYLDAGYTLVSNDFNGQSYKANDAENNYVVHLTHGIDDVSEDKIITRTINYVDNDGNVLKDPVTQTVTLTRSGSKDKVTGEITWNDWSVGSYDAVKSPLIDGYNEPNVLEVPQADVSSDDEDSVVNVVYTPEEPEPEVPETPQPSEPEVPNVLDVEEPSVSESKKPVNEEQNPFVNKEVVTEQPVVNTTDTVVKDTTKVTPVVENKVNSPVENNTVKANDLPQMGDKENIGSVIAGFSTLGMLFGLLGYKSKKKHD